MKTSDSSNAPPDTPARAIFLAFCVYSLLAILVIASLWGFTADDSFIVYRYAANMADGQGLTYNPGETISALTSPFHAILCSLLALLPFSLVVSNKVLAVCVLSGTLGWACRQLNYGPFSTLLLVGLVISSPHVLLWSVGGLETPYLLALLAIAFCLSRRFRTDPTWRRGLFLSVACGCSFLTRFDSILLVGPLLVHSVVHLHRQRQATIHRVIALLLPTSLLAGSWLLFSALYFHDIFPTSFYSKGLVYSWYGVATNSVYILQFLVLSGLPVVLFVLFTIIGLRRETPFFSAFFTWGGRHAGVLVGLLLSTAYAAGMVTTHMMFSYRFLIPFLPILLFLALDLYRDFSFPAAASSTGSIATATFCIVLLQGTLLVVLLTTSLNIGVIGEYRSVDRDQYEQFTDLLADQSASIRAHWTRNHSDSEIPVIYVYAAGVPGYLLADYRIVDSSIISYRHYFRGRSSGISRAANYLLVTSRHGPLERQLGGLLAGLERLSVADRSILFDGKVEEFAVYYNHSPIDLQLPPYIDGSALAPSLEGSSMQ